MEQDRILVAIISIGLVIASVLGSGLWLFYPKSQSEIDSFYDISLTKIDSESNELLNFDPKEYLNKEENNDTLKEVLVTIESKVSNLMSKDKQNKIKTEVKKEKNNDKKIIKKDSNKEIIENTDDKENYIIQVTSSKDLQAVKNLKAKIDNDDLNGNILEKIIDDKVYYRLRYGPLTEKKALFFKNDLLKKMNIEVVIYNID